MDNSRTTMLLFVLCLLSSGVFAGPPAIVHSGRILDAATEKPIPGVDIIVIPDDLTRSKVMTSLADSTGVYHLSYDGSAEVLFVKTGYDLLIVRWPQEFEGSDRGGCGINLGPVRLASVKKE